MTLQELLVKARRSPYYGYCFECPVCKNDSCEPGEWVEHMKVSPDYCYICGWRESNGTEAYPDNTDYVRKCWQLQIAPYLSLDMGYLEE